MGESFEAKLIAASSKEVFKKAKHILHAGEVLCCHEVSPGVLHAVCRDAKGFVSRAELRNFPDGPFSGSCTCNSEYTGFCPHSMAAALYHAKYTIKYKAEEEKKDAPAQYAGLKFSGLPELVTQMFGEHAASIEISTENEFPHAPSKFEKVHLSVTLKSGKKEYFGNLNNLRTLHFNKALATTLTLADFSLQDRQIIRFLALNAATEGTGLSLDAEQLSSLFHCIGGFQGFRSLGKKVVIHTETASPALLIDKVKAGSYVLKSALLVKDATLPLNDVKLVFANSGCWVGMLGEYWWVPARSDSAWLRNFFRSTFQPCDAKGVQSLIQNKDSLPVKLILTDSISVKQRKFRTLYDGRFTEDGTLKLDVQFDYGGRLCRTDQTRLAAHDGNFWRRNTRGEFEVMKELIDFGFKRQETKSRKDVHQYLTLHDREAIGLFIDEVVPRWFRENRDCLLSSGLAAICGDASRFEVNCEVVAEESSRFILRIALTAGGVPISWNSLVEAADKNEFFISSHAQNSFVKIPVGMRRLAAMLGDIVTSLPPDAEHPECDVISLPKPAAIYWAETASGVPGAVPFKLLKIKAEYDEVKSLSELDASAGKNGVFTGELRKYQEAGVCWLTAMAKKSYNLILADEMGLGKTIQTLAALAFDTKSNLPALIICPTSLTDNWYREATRFTPSLKTVKVCGQQKEREEIWNMAESYDIMICSYAIAKRDLNGITPIPFKYLVLDEAQHIKNPQSISAVACKAINADHKLVLTGTPLENSAEDLWSIFDFLHPGLLGPLRTFRAKYASLLQNSELMAELVRRTAPFILRRRKENVCEELPKKQEQILRCTMDNGQKVLYERVSEEAKEKVRLAKDGKLTRMDVLASLLRLRQICCDPALLPEDILHREGEAILPPPSAKMELLQELLEECLDSRHKVLVFSQFTSLLQIIKEKLDEKNIRYEYLDGSTRDRMERVDNFNKSPDIRVFLLSLKAGGLGLNLTSADTVIIYDPWWNPAAEAQAEDRTHRIGQTQNVNCIKLVVADSIEEKVIELQNRKKELFDVLIEEGSALSGSLSLDDFEFLLNE